jgi:hypothetical protein
MIAFALLSLPVPGVIVFAHSVRRTGSLAQRTIQAPQPILRA